jgi:hypothetical protein
MSPAFVLPILLVLLVPHSALAQAAAAPVAATESTDYLFPTGAGLLIFHVAAARTADFDAVASRLTEALKTASSGARQAQAAGWRIYKSAEAPGETVPYLFVIDPAVDKASYDPLLLLAETLPAELQSLFERMKAAVVRVERMALNKIR